MASNHSYREMLNKGVPKAGVVYGIDPIDESKVRAIQVDAFGQLIVSGSAGAGAAMVADVEVAFYVASVDDTGGEYLEGDLLKNVSVYSLADGSTISSTWYNEKNSTTIGVPPGSDLELKVGPGLTDTELRASPVDINVTNTTERQFIPTRITGASGTVTAGALEVSIAVESGYAVVQGTYMPAGYTLTIRAEMQDTIEAITVDATAGSVLVMEVR